MNNSNFNSFCFELKYSFRRSYWKNLLKRFLGTPFDFTGCEDGFEPKLGKYRNCVCNATDLCNSRATPHRCYACGGIEQCKAPNTETCKSSDSGCLTSRTEKEPFMFKSCAEDQNGRFKKIKRQFKGY